MNNAKTLYDKTGAAFELDHEIDGTAYVRPMVKVFFQAGYVGDDDFHEEEGYEPAAYIVAMDRTALFDAPPVQSINQDIAAKNAELEALKAEMKKTVRSIDDERRAAEHKLRTAQRQLDDWMKTHKGMIDLGNLLDGKVLYPLSVKQNHYHTGRDIPQIPQMKDIGHLKVKGGDFEKGRQWTATRYLSDNFGCSFQFFDTEEKRATVISSEFDYTCNEFRKKPNFDVNIYTGTRLHFGTLMEWVETHPSLSIPDDIQKMKEEHDAALIEERKAKLAAELASINAA